MAKETTVFASNLQSLRKQKGVTQEQLASFLGVSPQAVSKWENGSYPEGDLLPKISEYFEVSISYRYGQETEKKSFEQMVLDELYSLHEKENEKSASSHEEYFEKIYEKIAISMIYLLIISVNALTSSSTTKGWPFTWLNW